MVELLILSICVYFILFTAYSLPTNILGGLYSVLFFIYLFLTALGLHCRTRTFSSCGKQGLCSSCGGRTSRCRAVAPGHASFSCCGTWAYLPHGMWDLPRPGIEPVSPALQGRFFNH